MTLTRSNRLAEALTSTRAWRIAWLGSLWLVVTSYNLEKPYTMDDAAHLTIAQWIGGHPFHPMSGLLNWAGVYEPIFNTNQPHLFFYLLALWTSVFGFGELATHALQSLFSLICIVLFYRLARFCVKPLAIWATALLVLGPAFVVEQNMMVDVPLLALWLGFFNLLICEIEAPNQDRRYVLMALVCSAACLVKYSSLVLCFMLYLSLLLEQRSRQYWIALLPPLVLGSWCLFNYIDYGAVHILARKVRDFDTVVTFKAAAIWVITIGGILPLGAVFAVEALSKRTVHRLVAYTVIAAALVGLALLVAFGVATDIASDQFLRIFFVANGLATLVALIWPVIVWLSETFPNNISSPKTLPQTYLLLWLIVTTLFYVFLSPFIAPRHALLVLPPLLLILGRSWRNSLTQTSKLFALVATISLSVGLCISDWRLAQFYKEEANAIAASLPTGTQRWASGHGGWQWYAAMNGIPQVDIQNTKFKHGDFLAVAPDIYHQDLLTKVSLKLVKTVALGSDVAGLVCTGRGDRFYATRSIGPWSFSRNCGGRIEVFQVE